MLSYILLFRVTLLTNFDFYLCLRVNWVPISQKVGSLLGPYLKAWGSLLGWETVYNSIIRYNPIILMIIDNHFHRIISNFGYRLRALICWLSPKLYNWLHPIKARVMFPGIGFHSNVHPTMCIWHGPSSELLIGSGFYPEYLGKGATQRGPFRRHLLLICKKHCQRHNGPRN